MPPQEKIKVLIVDDIAETRENIRRLLQFDVNIEVIGTARSGREAIDLAPQLKPDVVLMDINMPDMDGITATETIRKKVPFVKVVILSVQSDGNYMRRAMLAGANDFLSKPPMIDELTAAIRRAGTMAQDERSKAANSFNSTPTSGSTGPGTGPLPLGKVIVVYSPKGGTGRTTIATNLAIALHSNDTKTTLVDANLQFGDVAVFLNEQIKNSVFDLTQRVDELDQEIITEVMIKHTSTGLHVLPCPAKLEQASKITAEQFFKLLNFLRQMYAFIVVDTTSYLTDVVQAALDSSDLIVLITTQEISAIKNANTFLALADGSDIQRNRILFTINRYDRRIGISPERVGESLRQEVVVSIPFDDRIVPASINRGVPFVVDNKGQPVSKAIFTLADLIRERVAKQRTEALESKR